MIGTILVRCPDCDQLSYDLRTKKCSTICGLCQRILDSGQAA